MGSEGEAVSAGHVPALLVVGSREERVEQGLTQQAGCSASFDCNIQVPLDLTV